MNSTMRAYLRGVLFSVAASTAPAMASNIPGNSSFPPASDFKPSYQWTCLAAGNGAELVTLNGRFAPVLPSAGGDAGVPLVTILRDSLPGGDAATTRLRYVWLHPYKPPSVPQRLLSAVPFFYWRIGSSAPQDLAEDGHLPKPLADLSQPQARVWKSGLRDLAQWAALDPIDMAVRAPTRAYRTNTRDYDRLLIQEVIGFLRYAPASQEGCGLTRPELDSALARLSLTKNYLGGLVTEDRLKQVAASREEQRAAVVGRHWELLRTSAERAGLYFEPVSLNHDAASYAILWFPLDRGFAATGLSLETTWKLLHISDPWKDKRLQEWRGYQQTRWMSTDGQLLPPGAPHGDNDQQVQLAPLAVYSLSYPRAPLLLVDFRSNLHVRRREIVQRTSDQLVSGVFGLSHFANWYYFAGNALYQFIRSRRGAAADRVERIDSYSEFRVAVALDTSLNPGLRSEIERRIGALSVNPLEANARTEIAYARHNARNLELAAEDEDKLPARLDRDRRHELASFGDSYRGRVAKTGLHYLTFGLYDASKISTAEELSMLAADRKMQSLMQYLTDVANSGGRPEVVFPATQISQAVTELAGLVQTHRGAPKMERQAAALVARIKAESSDETVQAECSQALALLQAPAADLPAVGKQRPAPAAASTTAGFAAITEQVSGSE